jgi:hypothetical protein
VEACDLLDVPRLLQLNGKKRQTLRADRSCNIGEAMATSFALMRLLGAILVASNDRLASTKNAVESLLKRVMAIWLESSSASHSPLWDQMTGHSMVAWSKKKQSAPMAARIYRACEAVDGFVFIVIRCTLFT